MSKIQTHIQQGAVVRLAAADLTDKENRLVIIDSTGKFDLAGANPTAPLYLLLQGGVSGAEVSAEPLIPGKRYRVRGSNVNFTLGLTVTSAASGLLGSLTQVAGGANLVRMAGVVEEANNLSVSDTGEILILASNQVTIRA
ncbi:MAG: hypothetical protein V4662_12060 [Verrucomicrobiota bacterium]